MPPAPPNILGYPDMAPPAYTAPIGSKRVNVHKNDNSELMGDSMYVPVYTFASPYQVCILKNTLKLKHNFSLTKIYYN